MRNSYLYLSLLVLGLAAALAVGENVAGPSHSPASPSKAANAATTNPSLSELLLDREKSLPEAQKRKDVDFFKNITTDDFLEVAPDAKVYTKNDMLEGLNVVNLQSYSIYDAKVIPLNDSAAVVTYDAVVQMTIGDERVPRYQHITSVWVNQGGKWLLKFQQATAAQ